ncbi:release factor glutamine methyltransferase [Sphingopyxis indica]|uniref:Release factor glutamine methyltransferase n=2 Tax=Sphingopyxis indica TaxID=436663 RepID=A0A239K0E4_9SPHN|nr:release factor glutamine methyltransferase [Sphingopyxis indica]
MGMSASDDSDRAHPPAPSRKREGEASAALRNAAARLAAVSGTPRLDAELLMAHALGVERDRLLLDPARFDVPDGFEALVARRLAHEPVAYILGYRDFWTIRLAVGPGALIPRPDSETLIEAAIAHFAAAAPRTILDLGTGPGTLLLAALAEWPAASGLGVDASEEALGYARANAAALAMQDRADFRRGDWARGVEGPFDLILCNPPYIADTEALMPDVAAHEPAGALFAGSDGLADYRRIIPDLPRLLAPGGAAVLEIGASQHMLVAALARNAGFAVDCRRDLGGRDRALILTL